MARTPLLPEVSPEARRHPHWALVERVAASRCFHASTRLCDFLFYVCDCALREAPEEATEQQIGMHVFKRPPGYNSSEDSIVRTDARLLRQKLAEYFSTEGAEEKTTIFIPKGHYLPTFEPRQAARESPVEHPPSNPRREPPEHPIQQERTKPVHGRHFWIAGIVVAALVIAAGGWAAWSHRHPRPMPPGPLAQFWAPFLGDNSSMVIYSNALFVGNSRQGLRYADPMTARGPLPPHYVDDYTGIGELTSVYNLARLFDRYHSSFVLKRSLLVTWDQASDSNLVFIGSVAENPSLQYIPNPHDFTLVFRGTYSGIINHHPLPGEQAIYKRPEYPLTRDYAILALLPGVQPRYKTLIFSGLTTYGTQAAVSFACNRNSVEELLKKVRGKNGQVRPFEAVIETSIVGGVPVDPHLVALHVR